MRSTEAISLAMGQATNHGLLVASRVVKRPLCKPSNVAAIVTYRCPLRCQQCDLWQPQHRHTELPVAEWKRIVAALHDWLGKFHLEVSGGEPLSRRDCTELLRFASGLGVLVGITTNAVLIDEAMAKELIEARLFNINVSLDGMSSDTVDYVRGVPGTFERTTRGLRLLQYEASRSGYAPNIIIKTIMMGPNLQQLPALARWADEQGFAGIRFQLLEQNFGSAKDKHWHENSPLWIKDGLALDAVVDELVEMKQKGGPILNSIPYLQNAKAYFRNPDLKRPAGRNCDVGYTNLTVNSDGSVALCGFFEPIGNLVDSPPADLWLSPVAEQRREQIDRCRVTCMQLCYVDRPFRENVRLFSTLILKNRLSSHR